jgi:hypothetical protein
MLKSWVKLTSDAALLGFEAQQVIGLRLLRIAAGGEGASLETERMVTEKIAAFGEAAATLLSGGSIEEVIGCYRIHVRKNRNRLSEHKQRLNGLVTPLVERISVIP